MRAAQLPYSKIKENYKDDYFETVLEGYKSETGIENIMLEKLPLFIKVTIMESIVDAFEVMRNNCEEPFEYEKRDI